MESITDAYPEYSQTSRLDEVRATEYGYLDEQGHLYLDFTGAGLAAKSQIRAHEKRLGQTLFGNPHSTNPTSQSATRLIEDARARVLDYLNASPKEYTAIFTPNATGAARLVAESYPFKRGTRLVLTSDNHNSINGLREYAGRNHARTVYVPVRAPELRVDPSDLMSALSRRKGGFFSCGSARTRRSGLFAYPAQSNFSGVRHPLSWVQVAQEQGYDVLLDAAAYLPTSRLNLSDTGVKPEFVIVSWYKLFGYPTGVGCLIVRRDALARLANSRPWFSGGTITAATVGVPWHTIAPDEAGFEDARVLLASLAARYSAVVVYAIFIYPHFVSPLRHIPGPKDHYFLLGQTLDAFKEIFQTKANAFVKPEFNKRMITPITGVGMVFTEGEESRSQRKLLSPRFAMTNMKQTMPLFRSKGKQFCQYLDQLVDSQSDAVNISFAWSKVTLDVIVNFALGFDLEITLKPSEFHELYQQVFDPPPFGMLLVAIYAFFPAIRSFPLKENYRFKHANDRVRDKIREIIRNREAELSEKSIDAVESPDLLTHMILESRSVEDPWSESKILENVLNFFAAGHESSASSLTWLTQMFAQHPEVQDKARKEIIDLLERTPNPSYMDLQNLPYLDNVLEENLRLFAPGISAARESIQDVEICGTVFPKGTSFMMMPTIINLNPTIWGEDVNEFKPERWDNLTGTAADPHAMSTFLYGPRSCIGRVFALLEMKMLLIEVLPKFRFEMAVDLKDIVLVNPSPALRVHEGLQMRASA
ncbi:Cytochrome P450 monooxygenase FUM15 [Colletotrichum sp. SAR11_59]|nr:Cytochrome P450 monooxygenase FUM15 [Colletotrichum sp. SAR11_59]